jgi:hypothetical protein
MVALCFTLLVLTTILADTLVDGGATFTSIVRLLTHPDQYEGKEVEIIGYYRSGQELSAVFLHSEDARSGNTQSAIWLDFSQCATNGLVDAKMKRGTVMVIGTFHHEPKQGVGHMGVWPAELKKIRFFQKHGS